MIVARFAAAGALVLAAPAHATFAANCSGCHTASNKAYQNGANASAVIDHAITAGMTAAPAGGTGPIATEIAGMLVGNQPNNVPVAFNEGPGPGPGVTFSLAFYHSTAYAGGATSSASAVGSPSKGSVSFGIGAGSPAPYTATYSANACATGADSFQYHATGALATTTLTAGVLIGSPTAGPTISTAASLPGAQTFVNYSTSIVVACPSLATFSLLSGTLPPGLTLGSSGAISGQPTTVGLFNFTVQASYGGAATTNKAFSINVTQGLPAINSPLVAAGGVAIAFSYQITATNPPHTGFNAAPLPAGVTVNTATGLISGTPLAGSGGPYSVALSATNATGTGTATLNLTIFDNPPVITSAGAASGQLGAAFTYQIVAANGASSFAATGLPPGTTIDTATGLISGTPTATGTFNATMTATNTLGSDSKPLVITITAGLPVITSPPTAGGGLGAAFSYQITATNNPTSFGASGLPPGLSVNTANGLVSGTPTVIGTFNATISATNATGTATQPLTITIVAGAPAFTSAPSASGGTGLAFLHQLAATNNPTSFGASGLPPGLSINTTTGLITGTPTTAGTFSVNASATNPAGTATQALTITITLRPPTVPTGGAITGVTGVPFSYAIQVPGGATGFTATGLPPGLTLDGASGIISGTPTRGGTYGVTVGVTNAAGTTTLTLTIVIGVPLPTVAAASASVPFETATPITLPVTGELYTVNIATLPHHGLVAVTGANLVTYTPATGFLGADSFSYTATNPAGTTAAAVVSVTVVPVPPTAGAALMTVPLNTPTTLDLAPFIKGSGVTGVAMRSAPAHGTVAVSGLTVTYSPRTDYFGADAFTYVAFGSAGASSTATVSVQVVGRPDPSQDRDVVGLVDAQNQAARRFAGTQLGNIHRRMETLHRSEQAPRAPDDEAAPGEAPSASARREPVRLADATSPQREATRDIGPLALNPAIAQAVTSGTLALDRSQTLRGGTGLWIAGGIQFGNVDGSDQHNGSRFDTDGVSLGADRRFGEHFAGGVAAGFARDEAKVGSNGTRSKARAASITGYGSFRMGPRTFIDALVGYGDLRFDSDRYVTALEQFAGAERKGRQFFGSVAAAYEHRRDNFVVSPYGRVDFFVDRLDAVAESGVGSYALAYAAQDQRGSQAALGLRAESRHETEFGFAMPRARAEYRREFGGERRAALSYADMAGAPEYSITTVGTSRNALLLGVGADLVFRGGLRLGLDYAAQRSSGAANVQGVRVMLSQDLDALATHPGWFEPVLFPYPLNVDFSYSFDDNVNHAREAFEKRWDNVFAMSANMTYNYALTTNARVQFTGLASGEKLDRHAGLGRFSGGGQAELQYRASGAYDAITYGLVGRALYEQYESHYRTGPRFFLGVNARRAITDRIELFGELGASARRGNSDVFNWREYAAKLNIDYALGRKGTLYLTGEYRRGDTVSSGGPSLVNVGIAEVFVPDDAYDGLGFLAYRFDARTVITNLGVNYPLGARDSIDLSWRWVQSSPVKRPAFDVSGPLRYIDNQYSLVYLMRF